MSETQLINRLVASKEYSALKMLNSEFNLFALLEEALREPAWSRIFAGILDSTRSHGLRDRAPLRRWLALVDEECQAKGKQLPPFFQNLPLGSVIRTVAEFPTPEGRRIDILAMIRDSEDRLTAVVGIENKLDSPEQARQIADYQAALNNLFPDAHKLIVYLTPNRRDPLTAKVESNCPCYPASWRTMARLCQDLRTGADGRVALLLQSLRIEIESVALREDAMKAKARKLIRKLWSDPDHRKAMQLIIECIPTPRKLWETELLNRIKAQAATFGMRVDENAYIDYHPKESTNPQEIKIFPECLEERSSKPGFSLGYILRCQDQNPDRGSEFCLRLVALCESERGRIRLKKMNLEQKLPASGPRKNWWRWENIWTGGSYTLHDFGARDVKGLARLFLDGARRTYPKIAAELAKLG